MSIKIQICPSTLGDVNSNEDNRRYAEAVTKAVESAYPNQSVDVAIMPSTSGQIKVDHADGDQDVIEDVLGIINGVWGDANY